MRAKQHIAQSSHLSTMAYDSVRRQLDQLLGADRNGPIDSARATKLTFSDERVCKHFLLGLCPYDLPIKRRGDNGPCPRTHSEELREEFQKADAASPIRDKFRWMKDLHAECRGIVMDEDRRIRNNARRLQDTYKAPSHVGLMVKSFETLRALGMVSETTNPADPGSDVEDATSDAPDMAEAGDLKGSESVEKSEPNDAQDFIKKGEKESNNNVNVNEGPQAEDEFEGFGEIRVIEATPAGDALSPAVQGTPQDSARVLEKTPAEHKDTSQNTMEVARVPSPLRSESSSDSCQPGRKRRPSEKGVSSSSESSPAATARRTGEYSSDSEVEKADTQTKRQENDLLTGPLQENAAKAIDGDSKGAGTLPGGLASQEATGDTMKERQTIQKGEEDAAQNKLEKFYSLGVGPDGLLMLDKKSSLRVCSSCGGYISLFDAESRLLSHYRGKTHRSMEMLRKKILELDEQMATEYNRHGNVGRRGEYERDRRSVPSYGRERPGYQRSRGWSQERHDRYRERYTLRRRSRSRSPHRDEFGRHTVPRDVGRHRGRRHSRSRSPTDRHRGGQYYGRESSHHRNRRGYDGYDDRRYKRSRSFSPGRGRQRPRYY